METSQTIINGLIIPSEWNENGKILSIAVLTFDEDKFFIANNAMAQTLMNFLRKPVTLSGNVTMNGNLKTINITQFQIHDT
ncbi:MAG: hypothetical protein KKE44_13215 [Proteobacteria bacterium]|nr:hypothetical protein [Pseudomonadota bacterium]MBU1583686.1 hypothetical protein [Pseudomonadota bacterium]MBU2456039.1 hypothetical protein [Pseudomonadota bacterium]MBU2628288.1 hypothetical protein [Pseudomonadota bacterium]